MVKSRPEQSKKKVTLPEKQAMFHFRLMSLGLPISTIVDDNGNMAYKFCPKEVYDALQERYK